MVLARFVIKFYIVCIVSICFASVSFAKIPISEQVPSALKITGAWSFKLNGHDAELAVWTIPEPFHRDRAKLQGILLIDGGKCQMGLNVQRWNYPQRAFSDSIKDPQQASQLDALGHTIYSLNKIIKYEYYNASCEPYLARVTDPIIFVSPKGALKVAHMPRVEEGSTAVYLEGVTDMERSSASQLMRSILSMGSEKQTLFFSKIYKNPLGDIPEWDKMFFPASDAAEVIYDKSKDQSNVQEISKLYVLNDYAAEIDRRGWWKLRTRQQPNNGYSYEILKLDPKLNRNPEKGLLPEMGSIDWASLDTGNGEDKAPESRVKAVHAFLNWYDSTDKKTLKNMEVAPTINGVGDWYLVSDFGVQYIEPKKSTILGATYSLRKEVDMSDAFNAGEQTGQVSWDRDKQFISTQPTAKNTITGEIKNVIVEPYQEIYFLYDAALTKQLGTPTYTSSKVAFSRDEVCLEWAGNINIAKCTKTLNDGSMKKHAYALIKNKDIANTYYYNVSGKKRGLENKANNSDNCGTGSFCGQLGHEYLKNIYRGNYSAVRRSDLQTRNAYRDKLLRGKPKENAIFKQWVDALTPYSISDLKLVFDRYLLAYKKFPDQCFPGGRQAITLEAQTNKIVMVNGFGDPTGETFGGGVISSHYEVPPHLVPYVTRIGNASSEGSKMTLSLINEFVIGSDTSKIATPLDTLPGKVDCKSEEFITFERNLIDFYERVNKEPTQQPPGKFVRAYK